MFPAAFCAGMTLPLITASLLRRGAGRARDRPGLRRQHARSHRRRAARRAPRTAAARPEGSDHRRRARSTSRSASCLLRAVPVARCGPAPSPARLAALLCAALFGASSTRTSMASGVYRLRHASRCPRRRSCSSERRQDRHRQRDRRRARADHCAPTASPTARSASTQARRSSDEHHHDAARRAAALSSRRRRDASANIGFGTGMTTHVLLASPTLEVRRHHRDRAGDGAAARRISCAAQRARAFTTRAAASTSRTRRPTSRRASSELRRHRVGAVQPVGERRGEPLHDRVLPRRAPLPARGRPVRAVGAALRDLAGSPARSSPRCSRISPTTRSGRPTTGDLVFVAANGGTVPAPDAGASRNAALRAGACRASASATSMSLRHTAWAGARRSRRTSPSLARRRTRISIPFLDLQAPRARFMGAHAREVLRPARGSACRCCAWFDRGNASAGPPAARCPCTGELYPARRGGGADKPARQHARRRGTCCAGTSSVCRFEAPAEALRLRLHGCGASGTTAAAAAAARGGLLARPSRGTAALPACPRANRRWVRLHAAVAVGDPRPRWPQAARAVLEAEPDLADRPARLCLGRLHGRRASLPAIPAAR